jgi:quinol monooxygenase YgiN
VSFVLVVRMKAREGSEERALAVLHELATASRAEPGCEAYVPCRDPDDGCSFLLYEQYRDRVALDEHWATEHFRRLAEGELFGLMESRERAFYETV